MAKFQYRARDTDHELVKGEIEASDLQSAKSALENQGLVVQSIGRSDEMVVGTESVAEAEAQALRRLAQRFFAMGTDLAPALQAYADELPPGARRRRLRRIAHYFGQSQEPSHELLNNPIDEEWIPLLILGASSDDARTISSGVVQEYQRVDDIRGQFASALAYPLVLLAVSATLLLLVTVWIIPPFQEMFDEFGLELPLATTAVLTVSEFIRSSGWVLGGACLLLAGMGILASRSWGWVGPRVPVVRGAVALLHRARFTQDLATLIDADVPLTDAIRISGRNLGASSLRSEANQFATAIETGAANSSRPFKHLPSTVAHAIQLGEKPKAVASILRELSWMYDQQTRRRLEWIASVTEPVFVIFLGGTIGFYVLALFMPLIDLLQGLS